MIVLAWWDEFTEFYRQGDICELCMVFSGFFRLCVFGGDGRPAGIWAFNSRWRRNVTCAMPKHIFGFLTRTGTREASMTENTREPFMRKMLWHALRMHFGYVMDQWYWHALLLLYHVRSPPITSLNGTQFRNTPVWLNCVVLSVHFAEYLTIFWRCDVRTIWDFNFWWGKV